MLAYFNFPAALLGGSSAVVFGLSVDYLVNAQLGVGLASIGFSALLSFLAYKSHLRNTASAE